MVQYLRRHWYQTLPHQLHRRLVLSIDRRDRTSITPGDTPGKDYRLVRCQEESAVLTLLSHAMPPISNPDASPVTRTSPPLPASRTAAGKSLRSSPLFFSKELILPKFIKLSSLSEEKKQRGERWKLSSVYISTYLYYVDN